MSFLRRKSGVYHEDIYFGDPEPLPQGRRRLSKAAPASSSCSSFTNTSPFLIQQLAGQKTSSKTGLSSPITTFSNDSREAVRSHLFAYTSTSDLDLVKPRTMSFLGAYMATTISRDTSAQASTSQLSLVSPTLPSYPILRMQSAKRALDTRKASVSSLGSKDQYATDLDLGNVSPESSTERLVSDPAPPPTRRTASFTPGMATRVPTSPIREESEPNTSPRHTIKRKALPQRVPTVEVEGGSSPTLLNERSGSPANSNVAHIGSLGLGSLHVVNGRASPAPSDKSKMGSSFWGPTVRRETSSCYPESEVGTVRSRKTVHSDWEDEPVPSIAGGGSLRSRPETHRAFSFKPGTEASFNNSGRVSSLPLPGIDSSLSAPTEDKTNVMAQEYISGLPTSPFAESPPPTSPVLSPEDVQSGAKTPASPQTPTRSPPVPSSPIQMHQDPSSPASPGSVRRYSDRAQSKRSFIDETLAESPATDRPASPASFFSVPEQDDEADAPFASAVEIQPVTSRPRSPRKPAAPSPLENVSNSREGVRGPISDSGYSSNTSLGVVVNPKELRTPTGPDNSPEKDKKRMIRFPFQKMQRSGKPVLVKPTPSTKVPSPTTVRIESVSALTSQTSFVPTDLSIPNSTTSLPASPLKTKEKRKKLVKLRRKSTAEVAGSLVVQRLASVDCFNVPPVSTESKDNLAQRALALPELDRTYRTQDHTATSTNASVLSLAPVIKDVRFPSPQPEEEDDRGRHGRSRSRSRGRSWSRPRSWLAWPKRDKSGSRSNSKDRESSRAELNDFGSVAELLGDNPYDIAQRPRPTMPPSAWHNRPDFMRRRTSPSNITSSNPRPKSSMDDATASTLSCLRRRSMTDRDVRQDNRNSLDERGGIPWRPSHDVHGPSEVPPLPPVPSPEEINRRFTYRNGYATHPRPLSYRSDSQASARNSQSYEDNQQWYEGDQHQYENDQNAYQYNHVDVRASMDEAREAPPPPTHSPRPMYVEDENRQNFVQEPEHVYSHEEAPRPPRHSPRPSYVSEHHEFEHAIEDEAPPPPPPPSHSPRPMDITPDLRQQPKSRDTSWSSQANAWKARRLSAGEALRRSWGKFEQYYRAPQPPNDENSAAPRRKPVPHRWSMQEDNQQPSYQQWRSGDVQQQDDTYYGWPPHQPMYAQDAVRYPLENDYYHDEDYRYNQHEQYHPDQYHNQPGMDHSHQVYDDYSCYPQQQTNNHWQHPHPQQSQPYNFYREYNNHNQFQQHRQSPSHSRQSPARPSSQRQTTFPPLSNYNSHPSPPPQPRPTSRHSHSSHRSLAEELHPELYSSPTQQQRSPHPHSRSPQAGIGRYSGGLDFNYGTSPPAQGFDGANRMQGDATRDRRKRHSWLDMESYGIDLGDVPGVPVVVGSRDGRMIYR